MLLNAQIGAISALIVLTASFMGYKKMILKKAELFEDEAFEIIEEELDDPHGLWEEDDKTVDNAAQLYKEEKQRAKKAPILKNTISGFAALLAPFRIMGYIVLVYGFFWLTDNHYFDAISYLLGLVVMPLSVTIFMFLQKRD